MAAKRIVLALSPCEIGWTRRILNMTCGFPYTAIALSPCVSAKAIQTPTDFPNSRGNTKTARISSLIRPTKWRKTVHWKETLNRFVCACLLFACVGGLHAASTILAATSFGPIKSADGGNTWSVIPVNFNSGLLSGQPASYAVAVDPKTPSTWYFTGYAGVYGFYKSLDSGQTWTGTPLLSFVPVAGSIVIDPVATNTIYMRATAGASSSIFIVRSTDSGATWSTLRLPNTAFYTAAGYPAGALAGSITTDPKISGVVYATADDIFKSVDFGTTWTVLSTAVDTSPVGPFVGLGRVDVDPGNSQVLYASSSDSVESPFCKSTPTGGECGLYKSVDGGLTWAQLSLPAPGVYSLSFDSNSGAIYTGAKLAATGNTVSKSTDAGATWTPLKTTGVFVYPPFVRVDPSNPSTVYAFDDLGDYNSSLFRSTDGGATWTTIYLPGLCALDNPKCFSTSLPSFNDLLIVPPPSSSTSALPAISAKGVVNGASLQPGFAANSWATILGTNLASTTDNWNNSIVNGNLPTVVDGVSVTMGGKAAYVYFLSPGQINVLAPDVAPGPVSVTVKTAGGASAAFTATASQYGPAFFPWPANQVVATRPDYSYAVKAGTFPTLTTTAARPGDILILWGTGFGPTTPSAPIGVAVPGVTTYSTATLPVVTINNTPAMLYGAALASGSAGLYQIAIQVPATLADGDWPIQVTIGGVQSPAGAVLSVHH
jgi:uncharacterized protein (TIGR03437 family)